MSSVCTGASRLKFAAHSRAYAPETPSAPRPETSFVHSPICCHSRRLLLVRCFRPVGVGKSEFIRHFIRTRMLQPTLLVPSPTFALKQSYSIPDSDLRCATTRLAAALERPPHFLALANHSHGLHSRSFHLASRSHADCTTSTSTASVPSTSARRSSCAPRSPPT